MVHVYFITDMDTFNATTQQECKRIHGQDSNLDLQYSALALPSKLRGQLC